LNQPPTGRGSVRGLGVATLAVTAALLLGRLLGLFREVVFAPLFGAGLEMDALVVARTVPEVVLAMVAAGVLRSLLLPLLAQAEHDHGPAAEHDVAASVAVILVIAAAVVAALLALLPTVALKAVTPGISLATVEMAVPVLRVLLFTLVIQVADGVVGAFLNHNERYTLPALSPAFINGTIVAVTLLLWREIGIMAVAVGWLGGAGLHLMVQGAAAARGGIRVLPQGGVRWTEAGMALRVLAPIVLAQLLIHGRYLVERQFVSWLPEGSLSVLNYAMRVMVMPVNILANAFVIAYLPRMARMVAVGRNDAAGGVVQEAGVRLVVLLAYPSVALMVLAEPTVRLLFQRGAFGAVETALTAPAVAVYALGILPMGLLTLWTQYFYAWRLPRRPVVPLLLGLGVHIVLTALLLKPAGVTGVALATTISLWVSALLLARRLPWGEGGARRIGDRVVLSRLALATFGAGGGALAAWRLGAAPLGWLGAYAAALAVGLGIFSAILGPGMLQDALLRNRESPEAVGEFGGDGDPPHEEPRQ